MSFAGPAETLAYNSTMALYVMLMADGRAYAVKDVATSQRVSFRPHQLKCAHFASSEQDGYLALA